MYVRVSEYVCVCTCVCVCVYVCMRVCTVCGRGDKVLMEKRGVVVFETTPPAPPIYPPPLTLPRIENRREMSP